MKTSELIKVLEYCLNSYGDLKVVLYMSRTVDSSEQIFINYVGGMKQQNGTQEDELHIQDFPY